jgi:hypothetical protein
MRMSSYSKGRDAEYEVETILMRQGYDVVRSAGSKGPVDLVALSRTTVKLIQVKYNCAATPVDKEALCFFKGPTGHTEREIWTRRKGQKDWTVEAL